MEEKRKLRIAIFEPARFICEGAQRCTSEICAHLSKKHHVELFTQRAPDKSLDFGKTKINLIKPSNRYLAPIAFLINKARGFDISITGSFPSNFAVFRNRPCLEFCYSPPRIFYDLKEFLFKNASFIGKIKIIIQSIFLKHLDLISARRADKMLTVSEEVTRRVRKFYKRDAEVFYPGINFDGFYPGKYGNYILSASRFVSAKRPEIAIKSMGFVKNKKIRMKVIGMGENEEKIKELCKKYPNVDFLGFVSREKVKELYANCLAIVYIPVNEEEGYAPIEAGASEKLTIGANEGALKETIVNGKTGFLIDEVTPENIAEKIDFLAKNKKLAKTMGKAAKKHTEKFDWKNTLPVLERSIKEVLAKSGKK